MTFEASPVVRCSSADDFVGRAKREFVVKAQTYGASARSTSLRLEGCSHGAQQGGTGCRLLDERDPAPRVVITLRAENPLPGH